MRFRKRRAVARLSGFVHDEAKRRAQSEGRTVRETRVTISAEMLASHGSEQIIETYMRPFEYVTEGKIEPVQADATRPSDGRMVLILRGVPHDEGLSA